MSPESRARSDAKFAALLAEAARPMSDEEREAQRRSFAYGNTRIENPRITREIVNEQADETADEPPDH